MENQKPKSSSSKSHGCRRLFKRSLLLIILLLIAIFCFLYFGKYDEGTRAGMVVRVSKKGIIFKTFEGQLNLQTFGAVKGSSPFVETFEFSVERKNDPIVKELENSSLTGERVNLRYYKRYVAFPWRGKTKYFITDVERAEEAK